MLDVELQPHEIEGMEAEVLTGPVLTLMLAALLVGLIPVRRTTTGLT
jgi:hypothetical protein